MNSEEFKKTQYVLKLLANQTTGFYLLGGTALSLCYYHHRESYDLDFFTKEFSEKRIFEVIEFLKKALKGEIKLTEQSLREGYAKYMIYRINFGKDIFCKIDFVEDVFALLNPTEKFNDVSVGSLEDIYLRKIFAITGYKKAQSMAGADMLIGGRQEAKDFYDLFCLSTITMSLKNFVKQFGDATMREGIIAWFRSYDRISIKTGLLDLKTKERLDYQRMETHFKKQIGDLISEEIL